MSKGVPQGSILGPLRFTIYINDTASHVSADSVNLYVDETVLLCNAQTESLTIQQLQLVFKNLQRAL